MEIQKYAPVIIPTLNRFDHFKQCLESLEKCTGADKTEVYIGLDYPPSEKYVSGWQKIDEYLRIKEVRHGFLKLVVFRRESNCGLVGPNSNNNQLGRYISSFSDRYIYSEDDNVFSPNFLEYINKGLEKFEDDPNVVFISGYSHYPIYQFKYNGNNYFYHNTDHSAWGYATWIKKNDDLRKEVREQNFKQFFNWKTAIRIYKKNGPYRCLGYIKTCFRYGKPRVTDEVYSAALEVKGKYCVVPAVSKVRNIGWDALGESFKEGVSSKLQKYTESHNAQIIDQKTSFEYEGDPWSYFDYNNLVAANECTMQISKFQMIKEIMLAISKYYVKKIIKYKK